MGKWSWKTPEAKISWHCHFNKAAKNFKTISAYTESTGTILIFKIVKKNNSSRYTIHLTMGSGLKLLRHFIKGGNFPFHHTVKKNHTVNFPFLLGALCLFAACVSYPTWAKTLRLLPRSSLGKPHQMWAPFSHWCYLYFGSGSESGSVCFLGLLDPDSKNLDSYRTFLWLLFDFLSLKNYVNVTYLQKVISRTTLKKKISFCWRLEG